MPPDLLVFTYSRNDKVVSVQSEPISLLFETEEIMTMKHLAHYNILRMILHSNNIFQNHNLALQRHVLHFCMHSAPPPLDCRESELPIADGSTFFFP